jgi:antitoxin VapB
VIPQRHVKLFKNGRNQAVRIPREFELPGEDAIIARRVKGDHQARSAAIRWPARHLAPLEEDFPPIPDLVPDPVEL